VNAASGASPFRAQIAGSSKLVVNSNGGTSIGSSTAGPANGLYVAGKVGIGITAPVFPLDILNPGSIIGINVKNNFTGNSDRAAVYAHSVNNPGYGYGVRAYGGWYGVYGEAQGGNFIDFAYGVYGKATGTAGTRYGIYGVASGGIINAAGYFSGAVWATSYNTISDRKFKEGIAPLEHTLQQVMKLRPAAYQFKTEEYKGMHLPKGKQIGLIADEVKEVFPELVQQAINPAEYDKDNKSNVTSPEVKYEGINYQGLIPILIASVQELKTGNDKQQQVIEQQQQQINELKETVARLLNVQQNANGMSPASAFLKGITPNPAQGTALIQYYVPQNSRTANIVFTDIKGAILKSISISNKGAGQLSVYTAAWTAGTYTYTLYINGIQADSKKLVIAR
jgi:hypothetical protein